MKGKSVTRSYKPVRISIMGKIHKYVSKCVTNAIVPKTRSSFNYIHDHLGQVKQAPGSSGVYVSEAMRLGGRPDHIKT